jgi:hypothetical protein
MTGHQRGAHRQHYAVGSVPLRTSRSLGSCIHLIALSRVSPVITRQTPRASSATHSRPGQAPRSRWSSWERSPPDPTEWGWCLPITGFLPLLASTDTDRNARPMGTSRYHMIVTERFYLLKWR